MRYDNIKSYKPEEFRRLTGVKPDTFSGMVALLVKAYAAKHGRGGRSSKLSIEDMLLATLGYLREYRTYAHIAADFGISESNLFRAVRWVEDTLIKDGRFPLPGKKAIAKSDVQYEVVLVDAPETPCERPKKTAAFKFGATAQKIKISSAVEAREAGEPGCRTHESCQ